MQRGRQGRCLRIAICARHHFGGDDLELLPAGGGDVRETLVEPSLGHPDFHAVFLLFGFANAPGAIFAIVLMHGLACVPILARLTLPAAPINSPRRRF